ncbi:hypothetical protein BKA93DRAFT_733532 [Sparassis latifolia]
MTSLPVKRITVESPLLRTSCSLGEGPLYDSKTSILHFVDIEQNKVYHYNTGTSELTIEQFDEPVTCLAIRQNGEGLACTTAQGFAIIEKDSKLRYLSKPLPPEHQPRTRFNDGACDSKGRYVAGTLYSPMRGVPGRIYLYDPHTDTATVIDHGPFTDSNGLGWSADGKMMFFTDSLVNRIYVYDYDDEHGKLSQQRIFVDSISHGLPQRSYPDGLCIDKEGGVWSARWGGSRIIRYTKEGVMDVEVLLPTVYHVTACCFGGPKEDQLYVTTAHCGACGGDASRQVFYPDSGDLFVVDLSGQFIGGKWRHEFAG